MHALKSRQIPIPACAAVSSPHTDLTNSGESMDWMTSDRCVSREGLDFCAELYLGGHDPRDPLASPLHGELSGFPPLLIQVGSREKLLSVWWVPDAPEAKAAVGSIADFIASHTR